MLDPLAPENIGMHIPLTIGITAVGSGIGQAVLDSLRDSSLSAHIVGFEASAWAKGAYECDEVYQLPHVTDPAYKSTLLARCQEARLDVLIPGSDTELIVLADASPVLESLGCHVIVSGPECVRTCRDKLVLHDHLVRAGVPFATTRPLNVTRSQAAELTYPLMVKPRGGSGSVGAQVLCSPSDWERVRCEGDWIVQPYLTPAAWHEGPDDLRPYLKRLSLTGRPVQEDELSIQVMVSEDARILGRFACLVRYKAGVPMNVDPIDDEAVWSAMEQFVTAMIPLGLRGPCNIQGRITRQGIRFFEANPRFAGNTHVRALLGYNEVEAAVRHFVLKQDDNRVKRCLMTRTDKVGLRQMTETAVARKRLVRLQETGKLVASAPFERILITGASGYLGNAVIRTLFREGLVEEISALTRDPNRASALWRDDSLGERLSFVLWEMPQPLPDLDDVDLVIHAAAMRPVPSADPMDWYEVNVMGTLAVVNSVRLARIPYLVFVSSQSVYGTHQPPPWTEDHPLCPESPYAHSKAAGEALVQVLNNSSTRWAILRLARLYGLSPNMRGHELPHRLASLTANGGILPIHGDGHQRIDLLHVRDAAASVAQLVRQSPAAWNRIYNVGSGSPVSINELAGKCIALARKENWPEPKIQHQPATDLSLNYGMDIGRAGRELGWAPRIPLDEGLSELLDEARQRCFRSPLPPE